MGFGASKPEFQTVLADKKVDNGLSAILFCTANAENLTASWKKDGETLLCIEGKHDVKDINNKYTLKINDVQEKDEGNYTLTLSNRKGSKSCSAILRVVIKEWRTLQWRQGEILNALKTFRPCPVVEELRFLLFGPVGYGKSSTINTVKSILEGRQYINCPAAAGLTTSHTVCFERYRFTNEEGSFPFTFNDVMGVEKEQRGVQPDDIITALKGHMNDGYMFSQNPLANGNQYYNPNPTLRDQMHCLVYIIAADKVSLLDGDFLNKLRQVRKAAKLMKIPQVVFMTRVDMACQMVEDNLKDIYKSKKIKDNIKKCSNALNVPPNCIFPILNYHQDTSMREDINCLMLDALKNIVHFANDYVVKCSNNETLQRQNFAE